MMTDSSNPQFLKDNGTPNLPELMNTFQRCGPTVAGGLAWLDNTRFCKWSNQGVDGKKHDVEGQKNGAAFPFDGASDCRPMVVDDIINERAAMLTTAFWAQQTQPGSVGTDDDAGTYAVALWEHLMFAEPMFTELIREVELSAQYIEHYGWTVLAPRWQRQMGIKRHTVYLAGIEAAGQAEAQATAAQAAAATTAPGNPQQPTLNTPPQDDGTAQPAPGLLAFAQMIMDPTREEEAVTFAMGWYDDFVKQNLPEDMQDDAPQLSEARVRKMVQDLRNTGKAITPLPYLAQNRPQIEALKPWDEVYLPPELTSDNEIMFQVERVHESDLRNRIVTEQYDKAWVELAVKHKGALSAAPMEIRTTPIGIGGLVGGATSSPVFSAQPTLNNTLIEIVHAVYHGVDNDGIPAVYCTTFHRQVSNSYALHDEVEGSEGELPFAAGAREWWCRSITASRSVPETAHTRQNIIKGTLDSIIDRASITTMPPVNVYESPMGTQYKFGPAKQNYVKVGREPKFMEGPGGEGMSEAVEVLTTVKGMIDNSYGLMSPDVNQPRLQMSQGMSVQKFLAMWNKAKQQVLNLCRIHMDDQEFADITGAPAGWLNGHREDTACLSCQFHFDVRELDPKLNMERIEGMNKIALPNDVLGTINRGAWAAFMVRGIMGPRAAKGLINNQTDASQALRDRAETQVLKMFAGNTPALIDKQDPTAPGLLQATLQNVLSNPVYVLALNDAALGTVAQATQQTPQQILQTAVATLSQQPTPPGSQPAQPQRKPDDRFSGLLMTWLQNLQFIGQTQPENRQIGRQGVKAMQ